MKQQRLLKLVILLSILGIFISAYLVKVHYSETNALCDLGPVLSCSEVSKSPQAEFLGIPLAFIGLMGYCFLGLVSYGIYLRDRLNWRNLIYQKIVSSEGLLFFSLAALLISVYLTYSEFFIIKVICLFCLFSQVVILGITFFSYKHHQVEKLIKKDELQ
ncbi:MAG: vitamin K epoxide reductase family protein [Candidatus Woesearchaeota archaeon]